MSANPFEDDSATSTVTATANPFEDVASKNPFEDNADSSTPTTQAAPSGIGAFIKRAGTAALNSLKETGQSLTGAADYLGEHLIARPLSGDNGAGYVPFHNALLDQTAPPPDGLGPIARTAADVVGGFAGQAPAYVAGGEITAPLKAVGAAGQFLAPAAQFVTGGAIASPEGRTVGGALTNATMGFIAPGVNKLGINSLLAKKTLVGAGFGATTAASDAIRTGIVNPVNVGVNALLGGALHRDGTTAADAGEQNPTQDAVEPPALPQDIVQPVPDSAGADAAVSSELAPRSPLWFQNEAANGNPAAKHLIDITTEQGHDLQFGIDNYPSIADDAEKYAAAVKAGNERQVVSSELPDQQRQGAEAGQQVVYRGEMAPLPNGKHLSGIMPIESLMGVKEKPPLAPFEYFTTSEADAKRYADADQRAVEEYHKRTGSGLDTFRILHGHEPRAAGEIRQEQISPSKMFDLTDMGPNADQFKMVEKINDLLGNPPLPKGWKWNDVPANVDAAMNDAGDLYGPSEDDPTWLYLKNLAKPIDVALQKKGLRTPTAEQTRGSDFAAFLTKHGYDSISYMHDTPEGPVKHIAMIRSEVPPDMKSPQPAVEGSVIQSSGAGGEEPPVPASESGKPATPVLRLAHSKNPKTSFAAPVDLLFDIRKSGDVDLTGQIKEALQGAYPELFVSVSKRGRGPLNEISGTSPYTVQFARRAIDKDSGTEYMGPHVGAPEGWHKALGIPDELMTDFDGGKRFAAPREETIGMTPEEKTAERNARFGLGLKMMANQGEVPPDMKSPQPAVEGSVIQSSGAGGEEPPTPAPPTAEGSPQPQNPKLPPEAGRNQLLLLTPEQRANAAKLANTNPQAILEQRRGTVPIAQTMAEAQNTEVPLSGEKGQGYSPAGLVALKNQFVEHDAAHARAQADYENNPTPDNLDKLNEASAKSFEALKTMLGGNTEAGRALNILRGTLGIKPDPNAPAKPAEVDAETKVAAVGALDKLYKDTPVPEEVTKKILSLKPNQQKDLIDLLSQQFNAKRKSGPVDKAITFWKASIISGVKTLERVTGSQVLKMAAMEQQRAVGSVLDWIIGLRTKQRTTTFPIGTNRLAGIKQGLAEVPAAWKDIYHYGATQDEIMRAVQDGDAARVLGRGTNMGWSVLDKFVNGVFKVHNMNTIPERKFYIYSKLQDLAMAQALTEAKQGLIEKAGVKARAQQLFKQPSTEMAMNAITYSLDNTYLGKSTLGSWISQLEARLGKKYDNPQAAAFAKVGKVGLNVLVPFRRVQPNFFTDFLSTLTSPAFFPIYAAMKLPRLAAGTLSAAEQKNLVDLAGKSSVSAAVIMAGYLKAQHAAATGTDNSPGTKGTQSVVGSQPNSVRFSDKPGANWYNIGGLGVIPMVFNLGADLYDVTHKQLPEAQSTSGAVAKAVGQTLLSNPLTKAQDEVANLANPGSGTKLLGGVLSGFVPAIASEASTLFDNYRRDPTARPTDSVPGAILKQVEARTPGLRNLLPVKTDALGRPLPESPENGFNALYPSRAKELDDPFYKELTRLDVSMPAERMKPGETEQQFQQRVKEGGALSEQAMRSAVESPAWQNLPDYLRKDILEQLRQTSNAAMNKKDSIGAFLAPRTKQALQARGLTLNDLLATK